MARTTLVGMGLFALALQQADGAEAQYPQRISESQRFECATGAVQTNNYGSPGLINSCGTPMEFYWCLEGESCAGPSSQATLQPGRWFPTSGRAQRVWVCRAGLMLNRRTGRCEGYAR